MTISAGYAPELYDGNDVTEIFGYGWRLDDTEWIRVVLADADDVQTELVQDDDYTVSGVGVELGGNITILDLRAITGEAVVTTVPTGWKLAIFSDVPESQTTNLTNGGAFNPTTVMGVFDRQTRMIQQLQEESDRSLKVTLTSEEDPTVVVGEVYTARDEAEAAASAAGLSEAAAAASAVSAAADAVLTAADVVSTNADAVSTAADRVQTGLDAVATAADRVQTGLDAASTAADVVTTTADAASTASDAIATAADAASTAADVVTTTADAASTAADAIATAADAASTAADAISSAASASAAGTSATNAATSETNALGYLNNFLAIATDDYGLVTESATQSNDYGSLV